MWQKLRDRFFFLCKRCGTWRPRVIESEVRPGMCVSCSIKTSQEGILRAQENILKSLKELRDIVRDINKKEIACSIN